MGNIPVVYEDNWLLIVDKPPGLLTVPSPHNDRRTLESVLNAETRSPGGPGLFPCHRLDRETSGTIIFAKGRQAQKRMMDLFRSRRVKKTYIAFVQGRVEGHGRITIPLEGAKAFTRYHAVRSARLFSVVKAFPETGRKNQIRLHFKALGHPVVGESRFAFRKDFALRARRLMLHAESVEFDHPFSKRHIKAGAPLPADMRRFLEEHE